MRLRVEEYKSVTIEDIMRLTGLDNPWSDGSKYSQYRQKELLLKEAKKQNLLYRIEKSHPIEDNLPTSDLNLTVVPHRVIRLEDGKVVIEINRKDIPSRVVPNPRPKPSYHVIDVLGEEDCYHNGFTPQGIQYRFEHHKNVTLHIITR